MLLIELEEVQMTQASDEALEAVVLATRREYTPGCNTWNIVTRNPGIAC
jgi:hypothetical protein